jgi:hypothetical protein
LLRTPTVALGALADADMVGPTASTMAVPSKQLGRARATPVPASAALVQRITVPRGEQSSASSLCTSQRAQGGCGP